MMLKTYCYVSKFNSNLVCLSKLLQEYKKTCQNRLLVLVKACDSSKQKNIMECLYSTSVKFKAQ